MKRLDDMALHRGDGDADGVGDVALGEAVELGHQENPSHDRRQAVETPVDVDERLKQDRAGLRIGRDGLGLCGERFEVSGLDLATPVEVGDESLGDDGQESARFARADRRVLAQQTHEGVVCEVGGVAVVAELAVQPVAQPAVMIVIERGHAGRVGACVVLASPVVVTHHGVGLAAEIRNRR
ncbi:hypothetical protein PAN31108_01040 [Pandoraea anhela]|uniref:Uncharacterized protein n=1 Tax=Pandoraea anhela TaxID=2508295 RepID=A0A5E4SZN0_9BURK|nr:hypothetical protein PAN31108_01040 [Pandoraea anhela]